MRHHYSSTSQRIVRNEHPVAMLLGEVRVRRVYYLTLVPIKPPPSCVICAQRGQLERYWRGIYTHQRSSQRPRAWTFAHTRA
jgi:hypothetical protein